MSQPKVLEAFVGPYNINVTVLFDGYMQQNAALVNPSNYQLSHGAYVTSIESNNIDTVILTVENLYGRTYFDLFVSSNIQDQFGNSLDSDYNHAIIELSSTAAGISGIAGNVKTKDEINKLYEDSEYWYLATTGGIDVVYKDNLENKGFVLDAYGYNSITALDGYVYFGANDGYIADAYQTGVYSIALSNLENDSTDYVIEKFSYPTIQSNYVNTLHAGTHANNGILVITTSEGATVSIHDRIIHYSNGSDIGTAALDEGGSILYLANNTLGRLEVYYNIHTNNVSRNEPDAYYSVFTSPEISNPTINDISLAYNASIMDPDSNVIYIATDDKLTRIDADESDPGYSEADGISFTYGTEESDAIFKVLGGQTDRIIAVDVNMDLLQLFVLSNDVEGNGGLTTINLPSNTQFSYQSYELGTLISDDLRDIAFKNL